MIRVRSTVSSIWAAPKPGVISGDDHRSGDEKHGGDREEGRRHDVRERRDDSPCPIGLAFTEQAGEDRDERRPEGPGRHELEDEVGQPERGEERVELALGTEDRAEDDEADPAEDARRKERDRDDQPRAGQRV